MVYGTSGLSESGLTVEPSPSWHSQMFIVAPSGLAPCWSPELIFNPLSKNEELELPGGLQDIMWVFLAHSKMIENTANLFVAAVGREPSPS